MHLQEQTMVTASCHCAAVRLELAELPAAVTDCNCSVCRRYGALWAYYTPDQVRLDAEPEALAGYSWGDRTIEFRHCRHCGCVTHYESTDKHAQSRIAINARMLPPGVTGSLPVRHFDGADSWEYLD
jgi:hypothetical protein